MREYKKAGGTYQEETEKPKMNTDKIATKGIKKWFGQEWLSVNDFLRNKEIQCGIANTQDDYNEYPLCRPKKILEKIPKPELKKMIAEKNKLKSEHLITKRVLKTDKYNVK